VYEHILDLRAVMLEYEDPYDNIDVDNSYYFTYDGTSSYSYVCHGCYQAYGGMCVYNP
jgi:hypothetical protein